ASDWLDDQQEEWRREIRVCEEEVTQARAELRQRQHADFSGRQPDTTVQEGNLRRAKDRLEFAEERLKAVRHWQRQLPVSRRDTYEGPSRRLAFFLEADLPRGLALLARQLTALEQYAALQAEAAPAPAPAAPAAPPPKEK